MMTSSNKTFFSLLAICAGNSPLNEEFPTQRPMTRSFDVFFHLCLNKQLSKHSCVGWFETLSRPLWRHCNMEFPTCIVYVDNGSPMKANGGTIPAHHSPALTRHLSCRSGRNIWKEKKMKFTRTVEKHEMKLLSDTERIYVTRILEIKRSVYIGNYENNIMFISVHVCMHDVY